MFRISDWNWKRKLVALMIAAFVALAVVAGFKTERTRASVEALRHHQVFAQSGTYGGAQFNTFGTLWLQLQGRRICYSVENRILDHELAKVINRAPICGDFGLSNCVIESGGVLAELMDFTKGSITFHECWLHDGGRFENPFAHLIVRRPVHLRWKPIRLRFRLADMDRLVELTFTPCESMWLPGILDREVTVEFGKDWNARKRLMNVTVRREAEAIRLVGTKPAAEPLEGAIHLIWSPAKSVSADLTLTREE